MKRTFVCGDTSRSWTHERLTYLRATESILFRRWCIIGWFHELRCMVVTKLFAMVLVIAVQCVHMRLHDIGFRLCTSIHQDSESCNGDLLFSGHCLDMHITNFEISPTQAQGIGTSDRLRISENRLLAVGVELTCCIQASQTRYKLLRRWGFEAVINISYKPLNPYPQPQVDIRGSLFAKALVFESCSEQVEVLWQLAYEYLQCCLAQQYAGIRPTECVDKDPAAWWRYAIKRVLKHSCLKEPCWSVHLLRKLPSLLKAYEQAQKRPGRSRFSLSTAAGQFFFKRAMLFRYCVHVGL